LRAPSHVHLSDSPLTISDTSCVSAYISH